MEPKDVGIWAGIAVATTFLVILIVKVATALWRAQLPLAALGVAISGFLVSCLAVVVLVVGFILVLLLIVILAKQLATATEKTLNEVKRLRENHAEAIIAAFVATVSEVLTFALSKDFDLGMKSVMAVYIMAFMGVLHMTQSANRRVKRVGIWAFVMTSALLLVSFVYRYNLYATAGRVDAFEKARQWIHDLPARDLASLLLIGSLMATTFVVAIVAAWCGGEPDPR